ncbi:MAG: hypothetical protein HYS27_23610 [Deltaproteobacteria bacterium]|nr:hypothetical protein [Deltaproteobacteria bacterium]
MIATLALATVVAAQAPATPEAAPADSPKEAAEDTDEDADEAAVEAPPPAPLTPEQATMATHSLTFGDHLFLDGDWYRSISEYRRFLYLVRGSGPDAERAAMAIGEALLRGEQWDAAGRQLDGIAQRAGRLELRQQALFGAGRAYLLDQRPELAKPRFRLLVEDGGTEAKLKSEATWLLAWGHFDAGELSEARAYFQQLADAKGVHAEAAKGVVAALDGYDKLETKDPLLAGALSLIPGLGHVYLGQWGIALTSASWNGLFIFAAVSAWLAGDWGVATVLTLMEVGWYAGGVFGAVAGAYRYNRDAVRNWRDEALATWGATRELPGLHAVEGALPGTIVRFAF